MQPETQDVAVGDECQTHGGRWNGARYEARGDDLDVVAGEPYCSEVANGYAPADGEPCRFVHVDRTADAALEADVRAAKAFEVDRVEAVRDAREAVDRVAAFWTDAPGSSRRTSVLSRTRKAAAALDDLLTALEGANA